MVERQVARTPGATAVRHGTAAVSYRELNRRANRLARWLIARGVGPEDRVVLALPPSIDLVVALLAVSKAGGAYVPVDPAVVRRVVAEVRPALVLTDVPDGPGGPDDGDVRDEERRAPLSVDNAAYVILTSGSTGQPKGVVVQHRSLARYLRYAAEAYPGVHGDALVPSPASFDLTVTGLLTPLVTGGTVRVGDLDGAGTPPSFLKITPSHLPLLAASGRDAPTVDLVVGGEALRGEQLRDWRARHPGAAVINEYGPTETTVGCAAYRLAPGQPTPEGPVPIGRPVAAGPGLRPRPAAAAPAARRDGRAVPRRRPGRPRLPRSRGPDRGAVRRRPVRAARSPDVPVRRPRPVEPRRPAGVPGAVGHPAEDPRRPGGAG
nr:hypothetical protein GCM10020092_038150 [Actinoplanes digitatis]